MIFAETAGLFLRFFAACRGRFCHCGFRAVAVRRLPCCRAVKAVCVFAGCFLYMTHIVSCTCHTLFPVHDTGCFLYMSHVVSCRETRCSLYMKHSAICTYLWPECVASPFVFRLDRVKGLWQGNVQKESGMEKKP